MQTDCHKLWPHIQVVQVYISWTNTDIAPIRQLVGAKRISLLSPLKSASVSYHENIYLTVLVLVPQSTGSCTESLSAAAYYIM